MIYKTPKYNIGDEVYVGIPCMTTPPYKKTIKAVMTPHKDDRAICAYSLDKHMFAPLIGETFLFKTKEDATLYINEMID